MRKIFTTALLLVVATMARGDDPALFPQPAELDRDVVGRSGGRGAGG